MQSTSVSARLWWKTIFLNACFIGIGGLFAGDIFVILRAGLYLIGGFICTIPLLMLIVPLVNISAILPYKVAAKIAWLTFFLIVVIILFYMFFSLLANEEMLIHNPYALQLTGNTISGLLVAVFTTRRSLKKFYTTP